jgi:hypothetical protein
VSQAKDLIALLADGHQERALEVLLTERRKALGLRRVSFDLAVHPDSDPGVYQQAHTFLRLYERSHRYALVLLDVKFPGSPGSRSTIEEELQSRLAGCGWGDRAAVVAIDPELEAWVWSDSPHVERILGQPRASIRELAETNDWWRADEQKPSQPKSLLRKVLRTTRKPPSAALFAELASVVSVDRCADPAFCELRDTLRSWFGTQSR